MLPRGSAKTSRAGFARRPGRYRNDPRTFDCHVIFLVFAPSQRATAEEVSEVCRSAEAVVFPRQSREVRPQHNRQREREREREKRKGRSDCAQKPSRSQSHNLSAASLGYPTPQDRQALVRSASENSNGSGPVVGIPILPNSENGTEPRRAEIFDRTHQEPQFTCSTAAEGNQSGRAAR